MASPLWLDVSQWVCVAGFCSICTCEKSINYNKNIELNINRTSELKNSANKRKVNDFKIFTIFNEKFIFLFCELCLSIHNTCMIEVGSFTEYFKIMHFWITSWLFKKVPYDIALTCNYGMTIVIFWWCFCNT